MTKPPTSVKAAAEILREQVIRPLLERSPIQTPLSPEPTASVDSAATRSPASAAPDHEKREADAPFDYAQALQRHPAVNEWLKIVYKASFDRMLSDNERIWRTGQLFVSISLGAFAALVALKSPVKPWMVVVLGTASSSLMWTWLIVADNHRAFQQKSDAWLLAIHQVIGINDPLPAKIGGSLRTKGDMVQKVRWALAIGVTLSWFALWVLTKCAVIGL
jgi:hypothetical protein